MKQRSPSASGITLPELLLALSICGILASLGIPALGELILDGRMTAGANALVRSTHLAWTDAQTTMREVVLCRSVDGRQCAGAGAWDGGWIVFVNRDGNDPPTVDADEPVLDVARPGGPLAIRSNRNVFVFRPYPFRSTNGTVVLCDRRGAPRARAVIISYSGRARVAMRSASGGPLSCSA